MSQPNPSPHTDPKIEVEVLRYYLQRADARIAKLERENAELRAMYQCGLIDPKYGWGKGKDE